MEINERLSAIGYWEELCLNLPISNKDEAKRNLWFLGAYDSGKNEIEFLIYDRGMGIFKSLERRSNTILANLLKKYVRIF